jgi:hypothetical protein
VAATRPGDAASLAEYFLREEKNKKQYSEIVAYLRNLEKPK